MSCGFVHNKQKSQEDFNVQAFLALLNVQFPIARFLIYTHFLLFLSTLLHLPFNLFYIFP